MLLGTLDHFDRTIIWIRSGESPVVIERERDEICCNCVLDTFNF